MDVRLPDGTIIKGVPEGMSKADLTAKLQANGYDISKLAAPATPSEIPPQRKERGILETIGAPIEAVSQGVISGGGNVMLGGQRLLGKGLSAVGDVFAPNQTLSGLVTGQRPTNIVQEAGAFLQEDAARRLAQSQATVAPFKQEFPVFTGAGELGGEVLGTGPVGMAIAAPLRAIPAAAPLAQAIRTGGFSKGNLATRVAGGATLGGATSAIINPDEAATGAIIGGAVPLAAPVVNRLVQAGASKIADIRQMPNQLAAKIARDSLGTPEQVAAARAALQKAQSEGLDLTAPQALARSGLVAPSAQATMERAIKGAQPKGARPTADTRMSIEVAQEAARKSTLTDVTPDLTEAINTRRIMSQPLYNAADKAVVPIDADLVGVISRMPSGTLDSAAKLAKMEGRPFIMGKASAPRMEPTGVLDAAGNPLMREIPGESAEITGESLHYIKRSLADIAYGPTATTGIGRDTQMAARGLLDDFVNVFETKVPEYGQARRTFSDLSAPVNQAQVLREMVSVLEKPGGGERITPFLNILGRGEEAMLKRAGGRGGARFESLSEVLTPDQIAKVREVAKQLETEAAIGKQITAGQQRASDLIKEELVNHRIPNPLNNLIAVANKVLETLGARVGKGTVAKLAESSLSANTFDELLATLPAKERSSLMKAMSDPSTWGTKGAAVTRAAATIATPTNALAGEQQNQNALAR
jgi:hypothetical protein